MLKRVMFRIASTAASAALFYPLGLVRADATTRPPRIESVVPAPRQPHDGHIDVIFYDNFDAGDATLASYLEPRAGSPEAAFSDTESLGGSGKSMQCFYPGEKGRHGLGNRKIVFGDSPIGKPLRRGEHFDDVYWRIYIKHPKGWSGDPAKMSRATGFVSGKWDQAFILHVWGAGDVLTLDPATGVRGDQIVTTRYNDFAKLRWRGIL